MDRSSPESRAWPRSAKAFVDRAIHPAARGPHVFGNLRSVRTLATTLALAGLFLLPGCSSCRAKESARAKVVVSIFPIYDLTRRVAGPDADVVLLLPPGKSEHHFDPTPKQVEDVAAAKLGVMVGLGLDPWMEKMLKDAAPTARALKVGAHVPTIAVQDDPLGDDEAHAGGVPDDDHDHEKGATDPHCWLDPKRAAKMAQVIGDELVAVDPLHAPSYRERTAMLVAKLGELDTEIERRSATWSRKDFVTFHGSFGYFAERYHLQIAAVIEPFPGSTPTGKYIEAVRAVVEKKKVPGLFSEPQLDPRPAKILADELKIPLGVLDPVGGSAETDSYEKLLRFDVDALEKVLK
jgi:zinc transport system substrate-binding protein